LKPWEKQQWIIAPERNGDFVAQMEVAWATSTFTSGPTIRNIPWCAWTNRRVN
jgi:hypothetical protein